MSTAVETSLPSSRTTPEPPSDQRSSGFTAVNGRSPSHSLVNGNDGPISHDGQDTSNRSGSDSGSEKRKRDAASPESQSSMEYSPKRPRLSPERSQAQTLSSEPASYASGHKQDNVRSLSSDGASWSDRSRHDTANSDAHLAEALTTDLSGQPLQPSSTSPEQTYQGVPSQSAQYHMADGTESTSDGQATMRQQGQQGQRKRNFSNRTKTGCLTCRERKKKCDEQKPICSNCTRGNFHCKGYSQANGPYKSTIPVQPALQPQPQPSHYPNYPPQTTGYYEPLSSHQPRPLPQPQDTYQRSQYPTQWSATQQPHYQQDAMHQPSYQAIAAQPQVPSQPISGFPDPTRHPQVMPPPPQPVHPAHNRTNSQPYRYESPASLQNGQAIPLDDRQRMTAQLALNHNASRSPPHNASRSPPHLPGLTPAGRQPKTEKEKMLAEHPFQHRDPELKADRATCFKNLWRFNKMASDPDDRSDSALLRERLRQIFEPTTEASSGSSKKSSSRAEKQIGHLGKNVEVQAPFQCEYGYNISLGDDVEIRRDCHIMDECTVEIGARTFIGPGVRILTVDGDHDSYRIRTHQKRLLTARKVVIGSDVFIGAGAMILPGKHGRNIADGATIGAATIVSKDVEGALVRINSIKDRETKSHWQKRAQ